MKKILISLAILLVLLLGGWFIIIKVVIDADEIGAQLTQSLEEATGRRVFVSQTSSVRLFPTPQVSYEGLKIANIEGSSSPDFLSASRLTIRLSKGGLFTGNARAVEIVLDGTSVDFEVLPNGRQNWQFTGQGSAFQSYFLETPVKLDKAVLRYVNAASGASARLTDINGLLRYEEEGEVFSFNGELDLHGHTSQVMARMSSVDLTSSDVPDVPFQLAVKHLGVNFTAQGRLSSANRDPEFIGQVKMDAPNLWVAVGMFIGNQPSAREMQENTQQVTLEGELRMSNRHVKLENAEVLARGDGAIPAVKGVLNTEYRFGRAHYLAVDSDFDIVDMDYLVAGYSDWFTDTYFLRAPEELRESDNPISDERILAAFIENLSGNVDISITSLIYNSRSLNDISLKSRMQPGVVTVTQGRGMMPGQTLTQFSGTLRDREDGLTFDGRYEMQGRQLEHYLSLFASPEIDVPPLDLGRFGVRTNVSISPAQVRLSEFNAVITETRMAGSMIFQRGDRLKLESYLRIAGVNIDKIAQAVAYLLPQDEGVKRQSAGGPGDDIFDIRYLNTRFNWLTTVPLDFDSDFYLQDFVLFERQGEIAQFHMDVRPGEATLSKVRARYNKADITGSYGLRVSPNSNPLFLMDGSVSELNMVDFIPTLARERNEREWQEYLNENIELLPLQIYRFDSKLRVGRLNVRNYTFNNVDSVFTLENNLLSLDKFQARLWDGGINARMQVQAGTIPSLSASFAIENANLNHLSQSTRLLKHAAGLMAVSGQVTTSGVTLHSWFNNVSGEIRTRGRDISVQGFGIANLARAVPVARTVNDIERVAASAVNGGVTRMSTLEGLINIGKGKAQIPQMQFTSPEARGGVTGEVDLMNETIDLVMAFYLLNTVHAGETTPELRLQMRGDIDNVQKDLETRQLKDYIAQQAAKRALERSQ